MNDREFVLAAMKNNGLAAAKSLQERSSTMSGTELYAEEEAIPSFLAAKARKNMLDRRAGFVCKSTAGRVVKLLQPYDSDIFPGEPEGLPAQWGFVWSKDPRKARPFVAISTSPYMTGDCCTEDGGIFKSKIDNNVFSPSAYPQGWDAVVL